MRKLLAGAALAAALSLPALASGTAPQNGFGTVDGTWLNGLAGGQNESYISGLVGAGSTQAGATQVPSGYALIEFDTVASSTGAALPSCLAGTEFSIYNNGANTLTVYPNVNNNPVTGSQDTINNTTSVTIATHVVDFFGCAKNGVWSAK